MKIEKKLLNKAAIISLLTLCTITFANPTGNEKGWEDHPIDPVITAGLEDLPIDLKGWEDLPIDLTAGLEDLPIDLKGWENHPIDPQTTA